jgi:hypothetical protein
VRQGKHAGELFHAELAAREIGTLSLGEALELVLLYAEVEPAKFERAAVRWFSRYLDDWRRGRSRASWAGLRRRCREFRLRSK